MPPEERNALVRSGRRIVLVVSAFAAVLVGLCGFLAFTATSDSDQRQHLLGQSHRTQAVVTEVSEIAGCRSGSRFAYTLEWTEDGDRRSATIRRCGDQEYDVGQGVEIWSTDGMPFTESATTWRVLFLVTFLALTLILGLLVRRAVRQRRAIRTVLRGDPPAATHRVLGHPKRKREFRLLGPAPFPARKLCGGWEVYDAPAASPESPGNQAAGAAAAGQGTVWISRMSGDRPRGMMLYAGDDRSRHWRYLG